MLNVTWLFQNHRDTPFVVTKNRNTVKLRKTGAFGELNLSPLQRNPSYRGVLYVGEG